MGQMVGGWRALKTFVGALLVLLDRLEIPSVDYAGPTTICFDDVAKKKRK